MEVGVIMQYLILMWNIDQKNLVSRGWPCGASYTYSSQLRNYGAMPGWPAVCDCGISWSYSIIFETKIIVDDNTIVLNNIRLNYKSARTLTN